MHIPPWFWFALVTLLSWGIAGLLQKLSTNHISAESSLIWLVVGFLLLEPFFYPGKSVFAYSSVNLAWALLSGVLNALGAWALFAFVLKESITTLQVAGITCSLIAIVLLSA